MVPLLKVDTAEPVATGFPWDYNMDDELLKLLISKARFFEAQIRYGINGPLAAIEVNRHQLTCGSDLWDPACKQGFCVHFKDNHIHDTQITNCTLFRCVHF